MTQFKTWWQTYRVVSLFCKCPYPLSNFIVYGDYNINNHRKGFQTLYVTSVVWCHFIAMIIKNTVYFFIAMILKNTVQIDNLFYPK